MDEDFVRNSCGATVGESFGLATRPESSISYDWKTNEAKGVSMDFGKQPGGSMLFQTILMFRTIFGWVRPKV